MIYDVIYSLDVLIEKLNFQQTVFMGLLHPSDQYFCFSSHMTIMANSL